MAQRTIIELEDDLSGGPADQSIEFGLDGFSYAIDLNEQNAAKLREVLEEYVSHARKAAGAARKTATSHARATGSSSAIRTWAESNGYEVSPRGRLAKKVLDAYHAAVG